MLHSSEGPTKHITLPCTRYNDFLSWLRTIFKKTTVNQVSPAGNLTNISEIVDVDGASRQA